jgi:hypothetical protein
MPSVSSLTGASPQENTNYLLDANIWIFILAGTRYPHQQKYLDFVGKIPRMDAVGQSKIILPSAVLSEVVNRMMKDVFMEEFAKKFWKEIDPNLSGKPNKLFKDCYRSHPQYEKDFEILLADMNAYSKYVITISDDFAGISIADIKNSPPIQLDFTDYTISRLARDSQYVIITDDGDFKGDDNHILTMNRSLLGTK